MSAAVETQRKLVKQLKADSKMPRKKLSETLKDLVEFIVGGQVGDPLVTGFSSQKENPYKDKSGCDLI